MRLSRLGIRLQLLGLFGMFLFTGATVLVIDEVEQYRARQSLQELQELSLRRMRMHKMLSDSYGRQVIDTAFRVRNDLITWDAGVARIDAARKRIDAAWREVERLPKTERQEQMFASAQPLRARADAAVADLRATLLTRDVAALGRYADNRMYPEIDPLLDFTVQAADYALRNADDRIRADIAHNRRVSALRIGLSLATLLLVALIGRQMLRNIYSGVENLRGLTERMRKRDYATQPRYRPSGELGSVMDAFLEMRDDVQRSESVLVEQLARNEEVRTELERRDLFQRSLLEAAQVAIMAIDHEGRWIVFNPAAERLLGWSAGEIVGRVARHGGEPLADDAPKLLSDETIEKTVAMLGATLGRVVPPDWRGMFALAELKLPPTETEMRHRDGHGVPVLLAESSFNDEAGVPAGVIVVAADLSAIKRLQADLRASETRAIEASHAKSAFLATMSHEIRTPMIGVTGMVEILAHTRLDSEQRQSLNVIQASAHSLLQIIGDILDFSKVEAGRMELAPAPVRLSRVLQSTVANFTGPASSAGLVLSCIIDERIGEAHCADALRLRQILSNFLSNAIKFTDKGLVQAALELKRFDRDAGALGSDELEFRVIDTGIGVDPEAQARLFQPFAQAEGDTTRRFGGTGLGLVICRRLAELMHGEVTMESSPGLGTTMRLNVKLPRAPIEAVEADPGAESTIASIVPRKLPTIAEAERGRSLILLVDDHPTNRLVIARQLALAGYASEAATDGEEGLQKWRSGRYALVLSDVHMPKLDGYQMAAAIREEEARDGRRRTPIIAVTAAALKGEADRCLAAGMDDYLAKPVSIPKLATTVQRWLPHLPPIELAAAGNGPPPAADPGPALQADAALMPRVRMAVLEGAILDTLTGGDPAETRALLDDFLASTMGDLVDLASARDRGDAVAFTRQAHKIKGAARLVGATDLAEAAATLEAVGRDSQSPDLAAMAALAIEVHAAAERLRAHVAMSYPG